MRKNNNLNYYFDREADVLYFSKGKPSFNSISQEIGDDIVVRIDPRSREVKGFTILNFLKRLKKGLTSISIPLEAKFDLAR